MKRSLIFLLHVGYWICYFVLVMVILGVLFGSDETTAEEKIAKAFEAIIFFALLPSAISFYTFYFLLFPRFFKPGKYLLAALTGLLTSIISALIGYFHLVIIFVNSTCASESEDTFFGVVAFMSFVALINGIIAFVIRGFITWFEDLKQKELLTAKNHEMEMALVKSQLDPHFLFNTINNIDVLILKDADKASDYLNNLSDIMRFMLFETKVDEIPLLKEIEYIKKYIDLQRIRTSNKNYVSFSIIGELDERTIAPMVFVPFIENAFKHTNNKKIEDAISVQLKIEENTTTLTCVNKFDPTRGSNQESHGLGNVLIQKRLELIYPNKHELELKKEEGVFQVNLAIKHG